MKKSSPLVKTSRGALRLAALVAVLLVATVARAERARVAAELRIESALFAAGLGAKKADVEDSVSAWLAEELEKNHTFFDWVSKVEGGPTPAYGLVARLIDITGTGCGTRVDLIFAARSPAGEVEFPSQWKLKLDDECNLDIPTRDAPRFIALVRRALEKQLGNAAFRQEIDQKFHAPLANKVVVRDETIAIPLSAAEMRADVDTRFRVEFKAKDDAGQVRPGDIDLRLRRAENWGSVCRVERFEFLPSFSIPGPGLPAPVEQHPRFEQILDPSRLLDLRVLMVEYRQALVPLEVLGGGLLAEP